MWPLRRAVDAVFREAGEELDSGDLDADNGVAVLAKKLEGADGGALGSYGPATEEELANQLAKADALRARLKKVQEKIRHRRIKATGQHPRCFLCLAM